MFNNQNKAEKIKYKEILEMFSLSTKTRKTQLK